MKMKKLIFFAIFILLCTSANAEKVFKIQLSKMGNALTFTSVSLVEGIYTENTIDSEYAVGIIDKSGDSIYSAQFSPPAYGLFSFTMPYYDAGQKITITKSGKLLLSIPIVQFSNTCGDGECDAHESNEDCKQDCPTGSDDDYCDKAADDICDPDCNNMTDSDCKDNSIVGADGENSNDAIDEEKPQPIAQKPKSPGTAIKINQKIKKKNNLLVPIILISVFSAIVILGISLFAIKKSKKARIEQMKNFFSQYLNQGYTPQQLYNELLKNGYQKNEIIAAYNKSRIN